MITKLIQKGTQPFKKISRIPSSGKIAPSAEQQEGGGEGSRRRSGDSQQSAKEKSPSAGVGGRGDDDNTSTSNNIDPGSPNSTMARLDAEGRGDDAAADKHPRILRRGEEKNDPSRAAAAGGERPLSTTSMTHDARLAGDGRMMAASNGGPNGGGGNGGPFDVEQSPALASVDTFASTQAPLSPLSPGSGPAGSTSGGGQQQQQQGGGYGGYAGYTGTGERGDAEGDQPPHRMLWARAGAPASGAASGQRPPLAPSGTGSAVDQQQQQQQQQPTSSPPRPSHRGAQPWDDDGQAAMHKASSSSPSPSGSPGRTKGGGGGRGRGGGAAAAAAAAGQPPVDYTQPVSLEEAQAIAIAAQQHQGEQQQQQQPPGVVVGGGGWNHPQGPPPVGPPPTPSPSGQSWVPGDPFSPAASPHLGPAMPGAGIMPQHPPGGQRQAGGGGGVGGQQHYQQYNIAGVPHLYQPRQSREQQQPQQQQQQQARGYNLQPRPSNRGGHPQQQQQQQQHHRHLSVPTVGATNWSGGGGSVPSSPARGPYQQPQHHQQQQQQQQQFQPPHHAGPGQGGPAQHPHPHAAAHGAMNPQSQHQQNPHQQSHGPGDRPPPHQSRDSHHPMSASAAASRAPSEILKTLLRKKACLYEPTTSHAIATITWLVGRNLTMSRGYFTRQSLQAGVHTVVAAKIEAGAITRTKVNRCMQIILNSCFHYIIPRVDGSEEDGTAFSVEFRKTAVVGDDDALLDGLPPPWTDLAVPFEIVDQDDDEDAKGGRRGSSGSGAGGKGGGGGGGGGGSKRSVLLCFNENVRSAQDVFRCHNEFIRDAAHGANLLLTAEEWKLFFSGSSSPTSPRFGPTSSSGKAPSTVSTGTSTPLSSSPASLSPAGIRPVNDGDADAAGIQPPALTLGSAWSTTQAPAPTISLLPRMTGTDDAEADQEDSAREREAQKPPVPTSTGDVLGELTTVDLTKFRTTWCSKRYEHDTYVCGFAHVEVNDGWLRRDPVLYQYKGEMCPDIVPAAEVLGTSNLPSELKGCVFNRCPRGKACDKAHSTEEVDYHPDVYKKALCPSVRRDQDQHLPRQPCKLRDVCPLLHPPGSTQPREQHHHGHGHGHHQQHHHPHGPSRARGAASSPGRGHGASSAPPDRPPSPGAPMIYIEPAPTSDFDTHLQLPGLQAMFRRRCASLFYYYHKCSAGHKVGSYSVFGDNWGLSDD